ncbi:MAG TPA: SOS response-associated peptidase [Polyangiaceae bacterium]|nr:SOS response-associated peptidase [Polyangiaceae bacterium]
MCGRFSQESELSEIRLELKVEQLELLREFRPLYNIAPARKAGFEQAFVTQGRDAARTLRQGRWWMIPHFWSKPLEALPATFNARAEELDKKPFWRHALAEQRCLVPATGWREFKPIGKKKQPYHFRLAEPRFAFAGLWSRWASPEGEIVDSFAIVTAPPNAQAAAYHARMPLVMPRELHDAWLAPGTAGAPLLLEARARSAELPLQIHPSDPRGNDARFEGPEVVAPFELTSEPEPPQFSDAPAKPARRPRRP